MEEKKSVAERLTRDEESKRNTALRILKRSTSSVDFELTPESVDRFHRATQETKE